MNGAYLRYEAKQRQELCTPEELQLSEDDVQHTEWQMLLVAEKVQAKVRELRLSGISSLRLARTMSLTAREGVQSVNQRLQETNILVATQMKKSVSLFENLRSEDVADTEWDSYRKSKKVDMNAMATYHKQVTQRLLIRPEHFKRNQVTYTVYKETSIS